MSDRVQIELAFVDQWRHALGVRLALFLALRQFHRVVVWSHCLGGLRGVAALVAVALLLLLAAPPSARAVGSASGGASSALTAFRAGRTGQSGRVAAPSTGCAS